MKQFNMEKITVTRISDTVFDVAVTAASNTEHRVTVPESYHLKLTGGKVSPEVLVKRSFEFLLQREPNTSILRRFELPVIGRYFPDYEHLIRQMISSR